MCGELSEPEPGPTDLMHVRADFDPAVILNRVRGSGSPESTAREISVFFEAGLISSRDAISTMDLQVA